MNSFRISGGTLSLTSPDGETVELQMLGPNDQLQDIIERSRAMNLPSGWSGTFTISADNAGAVAKFFDEMQSEWVRKQLREAMRDSVPVLLSADVVRKRLRDTVTLCDGLRFAMPAPVFHEPAPKGAQWKRERSRYRYNQ
jgi:hypothetical protein